MSLKLVVESLDEVPEEHRALYTEENGKFRLGIEGYEDPVGLKTALQKEREAAKNATKQSQAWAALGKTPEEIQELLEAQQRAEEDKLNKAGEWNKLKEQMNTQHQQALAAERAKSEAKDKALAKHLVDAAAVSAVAAAKGVPELLLPHIRGAVKVIEENGEYSVRVIGPDGGPRVNDKGEFLTIADLVSGMRQDPIFGRAFDASGTTGGGATTTKPGDPGGASKKASEMTAAEKSKFIGEHGIEKWQQKVEADYAK